MATEDQKPEDNEDRERAEAEQHREELMNERALDLALVTLTGDVRNVILNDMKERKSSLPWNLRSEAEQQAVIDQITKMAENLVTQVVQIVSAGGRRTVMATLAQLTVKDGIKAVLEISQFSEQRHVLMDSVGMPVHIVVADDEPFKGERRAIHPTPDQSNLLGDANQPENGGEGGDAL